MRSAQALAFNIQGVRIQLSAAALEVGEDGLVPNADIAFMSAALGSLLGALTGTSRKPVASANFRDIGVGEGSSSRKKECLHQQLRLVPAA